MKTERVVFVQQCAGPDGVFYVGRAYNLPSKLAHGFVKAKLARPLKGGSEADLAERAVNGPTEGR